MSKKRRTSEGELRTLDSRKLADYILAKLGPMNQLKMQKLLYYVEAFHQAYFNRPLIEDEFEAWVHGPVSRKVWNELRDVSLIYGTFYFEEGEDVNGIIKEVESILAAEQVDLVGDVLEEYGKLSSYKLECLTHEEAPWKEARAGVAPGDPSNNVISKARMREFYREMLYGN